MNQSEHTNSETILFVVSAALLLFFVYTILPILSPVIIVGAILFLLYPYRHRIYINRLMWLTVFLFILWFLGSALAVIAPFIIAFMLAYLLNPLVNLLERRKIQRWLSSLFLMLIIVTIIALSITLVLPLVIGQFKNILQNVSSLAAQGIHAVKDGALLNSLSQLGISVESVRSWLENEVPVKLETILRSLLEGIFSFITSVSLILTQLINIVIIPFVAFYLLKDFPTILNTIKLLLPIQRQVVIASYMTKVDEVLSDYLRGAIIVALIQGCVSAAVLSMIGVQYALILGIMTAFLDFIPYVGLMISLVVGVVAALFSPDPVSGKVVGVIIMYLSQKIFENTILAPRIIGSKVGVHPVLLILSLFIFGYFFGFIGLLIAVPSTAILVMSIKILMEKKLHSSSVPEIST